MDAPRKIDASTRRPRIAIVFFVALIALQLALYVALTQLSSQFHYDSAVAIRPLLTVLVVFAVASLAYLASIPLALRLATSSRWITILFLIAIVFRLVVLFSEPIQEVDIYRYVWDGAVMDEHISPYQYPPLAVSERVEATTLFADDNNFNDDLERLASMAKTHSGLQEVLRRVHFSELPTVYPPVSQVVFRLAHQLTPEHADVVLRTRVMKSVIVLFDLGVMGMLYLLLVQLGKNPAWCIAYGWSPLVIKEFANSGHLDSIAVFFVVAAIWCIVVACRSQPRWWIVASAIALGLGVGAKLFPIVLFPLLTVFVWKKFGPSRSIVWISAACLACCSLTPMFSSSTHGKTTSKGAADSNQLLGIKTFLRRWEINDLAFMVVEENIRPEGSIAGQPPLWFAITPNTLRRSVTAQAAKILGDEERVPFLVTRILLTAVFGIIVLWLCHRVAQDPERLGEAVFLTLAWFWLLSPTQNPWYWTWALPFVPLVRNRTWLLMSGLALIYYSRFWFQYHGDVTQGWETPYQAESFFDFVIVWLEYAPFFALLAYSAFRARTRAKTKFHTL